MAQTAEPTRDDSGPAMDHRDPSPSPAPAPRRSSIADGLQLPADDGGSPGGGDALEPVPKKRRQKVQDPEDDEDEPPRGRELDTGSHSSKRRRSANWPLTEDQPLSPDSQRSRRSKGSSYNRRQVSSPGRLSRFQEASMHDRSSDQPPSLFTRFIPGGGLASVDQLMEDYHAANEVVPDYKGTVRSARTTSNGPSHRPNQSVMSAATTASNSTANTKESGIFRFGRSVATTFNPLNIWNRMQQKWNEARQELIEEAMDEQARQLRDRALKAEEVYAQLKKAGQLGAQGTHAISNGTQIFTPGYSAPTDGHLTQRDSGIAGIEPHDPRPYDHKDAAKGAANLSSPQGRKSALHFRTPSFAHLKKVRSDVQLKQKTAPPSSPTPDEPETPRTLRASHSKKDLQKQLKLHKRVSDLEARLQDARRELYQCLGDTPPVPALPAHLAASLSSNKPRVPTPLKRAANRNAPLPSLPSERLLFSDVSDSREDQIISSPPYASASHTEDEQTPVPKSVTDTPTATNDIWTADIESAKPKKLTKAPTTKAPVKKRKSGDEEDLTFRPGPVANDDAEWEEAEAAQEPPKRKRGRPKKNPEGKLTKKQPEPAKPEPTKPELTKPEPAKPEPAKQSKASAPSEPGVPEVTETSFKAVADQPPVHASIDEALESMVEEDLTTAKVLLRDGSPGRPSAFATPSHPSMRRGRSASPGRKNRRGAPEDNIVTAMPNSKSVPPMPKVPENMIQISKTATATVSRRDASFEWPEDVF